MRLKPFFSYYGSKQRLAPLYPTPRYDTIIEPFSGSAGYSLLYPNHKVVLYDRDPVIVGIWEYLIREPEEKILALPDLMKGQRIEDLKAPPEAKWLMGFWIAHARSVPGQYFTTWVDRWPKALWWGPRVKQRIIEQQSSIRHWKVYLKSYEDVPNREVTWFVDPPYSGKAGRAYRHDQINYSHLADWCRGRDGQVIACESESANWLNFRHLKSIRGVAKRSTEVFWEK